MEYRMCVKTHLSVLSLSAQTHTPPSNEHGGAISEWLRKEQSESLFLYIVHLPKYDKMQEDLNKE